MYSKVYDCDSLVLHNMLNKTEKKDWMPLKWWLSSLWWCSLTVDFKKNGYYSDSKPPHTHISYKEKGEDGFFILPHYLNMNEWVVQQYKFESLKVV